jgi:hypothetical protein
MRTRLLALVAAGAFLAVALAIRQFTGDGHGGGLWAQASGTALYASMVYCGVLLLRPHTAALSTGLVAIAFCWAVEVSQLTGVPAALSARSLVARLVLGIQFDWADLWWYPVGIIPLVLIDRSWLQARRRQPAVASSAMPI